ncbi:MAG: hypothetical protein HYU66_06075 [Armatimonadetes bacterium]|nr:hypothetical protein [Armatimonadota bacterium]
MRLCRTGGRPPLMVAALLLSGLAAQPELGPVGQDGMHGPRLTDADFFAALDLARPGLERVAAAVAAGDYAVAKVALLAYYRARPHPGGHSSPPRNEHPPLAALTSWHGFAHALAVDRPGWKRFRLAKRDFRTVHQPIGWNFIRYVAFTLDEAGPRPAAELYLSDLRLTGAGGTVELDDAGLIHDWSGYDALEFRLYSPAAAGARISVVLDSEDLEFPETAQDVLDHRWLRVHGQLHDMGLDLDWSLLPFAADDPDRTREWTWCGLNRMHQWTTLMRAYSVTADEQHAREVVAQLLDWTADCPVPPNESGNQSSTWRTIEAGLRMLGAWPDAFNGLLHSPSFTPEACCVMLKSMVEHARHLKRWRTSGNWLTIEGSGLARGGGVLPELRESAEWRQVAADTMYAQLAHQVYPDGAQFELSTGYQYVALACFLEVFRLARRSGVELPADYARRLTTSTTGAAAPCATAWPSVPARWRPTTRCCAGPAAAAALRRRSPACSSPTPDGW